MFEIIDGDTRSPFSIAQEKGWIVDAEKDYDFINKTIDDVLIEKSDIVEKVRDQKKKNKGGPIMFLVGESMKRLKAQGDPEYVQKYIRTKIFGEE